MTLQRLHRCRTFLGKHLLLAVPHFGAGLLHISRYGLQNTLSIDVLKLFLQKNINTSLVEILENTKKHEVKKSL